MVLKGAGRAQPVPTVTPSWPSPSLLRALLTSRGGFTIDIGAGRIVDDGVAVCADPSAGLTFDFARWCDGEVEGWIGRNGSRLGGGVHLGGWLDGSARCWLDLVRVFHPRLVDHAMHLGRSLDEQAAFDLSRRALIHLGSSSPSTDGAGSRPRRGSHHTGARS
jgi:hypothetical protein